jgi:hypothetical protein
MKALRKRLSPYQKEAAAESLSEKSTHIHHLQPSNFAPTKFLL